MIHIFDVVFNLTSEIFKVYKIRGGSSLKLSPIKGLFKYERIKKNFLGDMSSTGDGRTGVNSLQLKKGYSASHEKPFLLNLFLCIVTSV